ncbi:hypothetical protein RUND412_003520 [Rhizina undulata]
MAIPSFKLASGKSIPALAFGTGTAWYKGGAGAINQKLIDSVKSADKIGYRHFDCAESYGTESEVGVAIKELGIPREELFITTKVWPSLKEAEKAFEKSLENLQVSYVDLYLLHTPFFTKESHGVTLEEVWATLEKLHASGRAKHIGVSNFNVPQLKQLLSFAKVPPAMNQIEFNPYCVNYTLIDFARDNNIILSAYSPLAPVRKFQGGSLEPVLKKISSKVGKSESQVLLRWVIEMGVVAITTSSNEARQKEFFDISFELSKDDVEEITREGGKEHHRLYWREKYGEKN